MRCSPIGTRPFGASRRVHVRPRAMMKTRRTRATPMALPPTVTLASLGTARGSTPQSAPAGFPRTRVAAAIHIHAWRPCWAFDRRRAVTARAMMSWWIEAVLGVLSDEQTEVHLGQTRKLIEAALKLIAAALAALKSLTRLGMFSAIGSRPYTASSPRALNGRRAGSARLLYLLIEGSPSF